MADPKSLVGRKVKLVKSETTYNGRIVESFHLDDKEFETYVKLTYGNHVRIRPPGTVSILNYDTGRLNIDIGKDGVIIRAHYG